MFEGATSRRSQSPTCARCASAIAMIFQEPMTALNPLRTIGDQIGEMFPHFSPFCRSQEIAERVLELLRRVAHSRPEGDGRARAHELSGGQRQRAMIAMALALDPRADRRRADDRARRHHAS